MSASEKIDKIRRKYAGKIRIAQQKAAKQLAISVVDWIKIRTRLEGEGVSGPLKNLKPSTIRHRTKYSSKLHQDTDTSRSNLTATGQLLDALRGRAGGGKVTIDIKPNKRKKELDGDSSGLTNEQVRKFVEDNGREFLKLSDQERDEVIELASQIIKEELRSLS